MHFILYIVNFESLRLCVKLYLLTITPTAA